MNRAAPHLAYRKKLLPKAVQNGRFLEAEMGLKKDIISKESTVSGSHPPEGKGPILSDRSPH